MDCQLVQTEGKRLSRRLMHSTANGHHRERSNQDCKLKSKFSLNTRNLVGGMGRDFKRPLSLFVSFSSNSSFLFYL